MVQPSVSINPFLAKLYYGKSFWKRVSIGDTTEDCWEHKNKSGLPRTKHVAVKVRKLTGNSNVLAHRLAWVLEHGEDPGDNLVLHKCNNPRCVNPNHLYLGDYQDNFEDAIKAGVCFRKEG